MISKTSLFIFFWLLLFSMEEAHSQFINLQITIEPELSATVEQDLNFGTLVANSGVKEIRLGDVDMGVFAIRALRTQNIYLDLQYPTELISDDPRIEDTIPLELQMSYNNFGRNRASESIKLPPDGSFIPVHITDINNSSEIWEEIFLYVYGTIAVGEVPNGNYSGQIVLLIEYD